MRARQQLPPRCGDRLLLRPLISLLAPSATRPSDRTRPQRPSRMAGIPAQVDDQGVSPGRAPSDGTARARAGSARRPRARLAAGAAPRGPRRVGVRRSVWQARRDAGPGDTRRATGTVPGTALRAARWWRACSRASQSAASWRVSFAGDLRRPGGAWHGGPDPLHGRNRHIQMDLAEPCRWGGTSLTRRPCAAAGRASFCLVRCTLRLLQARAAADEAAAFVRMDARSELACDGFRCGCCCTLLLYRGLERCDQIFELWSLNCGGAMGIRTPDLLHAMQALYQLSYSPSAPTSRPWRHASVQETG